MPKIMPSLSRPRGRPIGGKKIPHGVQLIKDNPILDYKNKYLEEVPVEDREDIIRCFAEFMSFEAIKHHVLFTQGDKSLLYDIDNIRNLCNDSSSRITILHYRGKYLAKIVDEPIFHKKVRLSDLSLLRDRYLKQIEMLKDDSKEEREEFRYAARGLSEILAKAQDEVEGKGMNVQVGLGIFEMGDLDGKSDEELINMREELLRKASRAIGISEPGQRRITKDNADTEGVIEATAIEPT